MYNCVNSSYVTLIHLAVVYLLDNLVPWRLKKELISTKSKTGLGKVVPIVIVMDARMGPTMKLKNIFSWGTFQSLESDLIYSKSEYSKTQRETSQVRKVKNS